MSLLYNDLILAFSEEEGYSKIIKTEIVFLLRQKWTMNEMLIFLKKKKRGRRKRKEAILAFDTHFSKISIVLSISEITLRIKLEAAKSFLF